MLFVQNYKVFFSWVVPLCLNVWIVGLQLVCSLQVCVLQLLCGCLFDRFFLLHKGCYQREIIIVCRWQLDSRSKITIISRSEPLNFAHPTQAKLLRILPVFWKVFLLLLNFPPNILTDNVELLLRNMELLSLYAQYLWLMLISWERWLENDKKMSPCVENNFELNIVLSETARCQIPRESNELI